MGPKDYLTETVRESISIKEKFVAQCGDRLIEAARLIGKSLAQGGKVLILGNGGSAADAQHMAAEMVGRMLQERRALPAIALTTDSSNLTAIANDYGFKHVFVRQIQALAKSGDVLLAISTSGNSENVVMAVEEARKLECRIITLTGGNGGKLKAMGDISLDVELGNNSSRTQETHIFAIHTMVDLLDRYFLNA